MTSNQFLVLNNSALKLVNDTNCYKFGIILEVNNDVVVKTWMVEKCIADYTKYFFAWFCIFCTPGFGGVRRYVGWLIFIGLTFCWGDGLGLWKTSQWRFRFQNWFMSGPLQFHCR